MGRDTEKRSESSRSSSTRPLSSGPPLESLQRNPPVLVELHALALEELALDPRHRAAARARADAARGVDDALPGDRNVVGQPGERVADLAGVVWNSREGGDLAVGR